MKTLLFNSDTQYSAFAANVNLHFVNAVANYSIGTVGMCLGPGILWGPVTRGVSRVGDHVDHYDDGSFEQIDEREQYRLVIS